MQEYSFALASLVAGLLASVACGVGVLPLAIRGLDVEKRIGLGYGFAGGLMFAASVYNLLLPAFEVGMQGAWRLWPVIQTLLGMTAGCGFLWGVEQSLTVERLRWKWLRPFHGRVEALVFIAMTCHSIPEGVAVGVGFASETHVESARSASRDSGSEAAGSAKAGDDPAPNTQIPVPKSSDAPRARGLGLYIAIAISIHNIPEGLAVALPMRAAGASLARCFFFAFLTSLPQPIAAVPASLLVWLVEPLMLPFLGFAAGAMMYLVIVELVPDALQTRSRDATAWSFMAGFGLMALVQVGL